MSFGHPVPNAPFFSFSSVPTFLLPSKRQTRLGKRCLRECYAPEKPEVSSQKRLRLLLSVRRKGDSARSEPWHRNDRFVRKFSPDELQLIVEPSGPWKILPDTCPIHPLLRTLAGLANVVPGIASALRLATRFLTSRHTLPFFHNLLTTQIDPLLAECQQYGVLLSHLPAPSHTTMITGLQDSEKTLTLQACVALTPHISFQISPDPRLETRWAYTERAYPPTFTTPACKTLPDPWPTPAESPNPLLRELSFDGTNALINLSPCFLRALHPDNGVPTDAARLRAAYMLAVTLIHELAHAVYICRFPSHPFELPQGFGSEEYEPFFAGQRKAELGHALETCLFGGGKILSLAQTDDFSIGLGWQRWPDAEEFYVRDAIGDVVPLQRLGMVSPKWETVCLVRHEWIQRQFEAGFWEQLEVEGLAGGLLSVRKELGARCRNNDFVGKGNGLQSSESSADRGEDEQGVVRPGQMFIESDEDVCSEEDDCETE